MGKYINSDIHNRYSDWHWGLTKKDDKYKRLYVGDIDRLWLEYDFARNAVVAAFDIKYDNSEDSGLTATTKGIYEWLEQCGCAIFIVYITKDFKVFRVVDRFGDTTTYESEQYADWLLSLRAQKPVGGLI